ncbi:MAG: HEAT repeat domain-containing protein [Sandaracinus sp.]|nr:HEAT repeat domain-containing protein [Sandaracinus sp.]
MGLFDFFGRKSGGAVGKHAARAADKRAQAPDRWQSLRALGDMKSAEAVEALLQRFTFRVDPSITDQEEKDLAMHGIVSAGEVAIEPVRAFLKESASVAWPVKMLQQLVGPEELVGDLLAILADMHTDYERDPQRKIDLIMQLEDHRDARIRPALERFVEDANETVRFHAVQTIAGQEDVDDSKEAFVALYLREESVRVRVRVLDVAVDRNWTVDPEAMAPKLPAGYSLDGTSVKKG